MTTKTLTGSDFDRTVTENDIVLVDFWADWCGPCRRFAPIYEASAEKHPDIVFGKVDTEAEQELAAAANIQSIPTLMAFREGVLVFSQPGALPAAALEQVIDGVKGLDMTDVHAQVAAQRALLDKPMEISQDDFAAAQASAPTLIDVREPSEFEAGHVPGADLVPLQSVPQNVDRLPSDEPVYVICATGNRSLTAAKFLRQSGIEAYSVAGGTSAWANAGREILTGGSEAARA